MDFPIVRRGYEPAAVDAHVRALTAEIERLGGAGAARREPSVASTASSQVQEILRAAETAAADIERAAVQRAGEARDQVSELLDSLRSAVERLTVDLAAIDADVSRLRGGAPTQAGPRPAAQPDVQATSPSDDGASAPPPAQQDLRPAASASDDLDGARLIALNMALSGQPRADADRFLAEHFQLAEREKLIDEVYAAVEG
jgi:hypothetical protein